ncbi:MAG: hypothetical protein QM756_07600 [Polyangiaceae bacterium]
MHINFKFLSLASAFTTLVVAANMAGCTTDADDPGTSTGGTSAASGGKSGTSTSGGSTSGGSTSAPPGTVCEAMAVIPAAKPGIADFDSYDGVTAPAKWNFPIGGDTTVGVFMGPFAYGDRDTGFPELFEIGTGHESKYALHVSETLAEKYGGGLGLWLNPCMDASAFAGISFWVRGNMPTGKAKFNLSMGDTTPSVAAKAGDGIGTCTGTATTCVHPYYAFDVTDTWTEVKIPWGSFTAGNAAGTVVKPTGKNITQIQWGIELVWAGSTPTAAPYELAVDTLSFY